MTPLFMYALFPTKQYKKAYEKLARSGRFPVKTVDSVIDQLTAGKKLDAKYRDHPLKGEWAGYRECHIRDDLLLIYIIHKKEIVLALINIGTHAQLFG